MTVAGLPRRPFSRRPFVVLSLVFLLSLPAVTTRFYASDEIQYFAYLRSLWFDRDLSFDNEYRHFYDQGIAQGSRLNDAGTRLIGGNFHKTFLEGETATGLRINFAPIGTAILWAPFYGVADLAVRIARAGGAEVAADGFSKPYIAAVTYASAVYGFLAVLLSAVVAQRVLGTKDWWFLAVWLGTPLVFYMYVAPGFSHATSAFAIAAFVFAWLRVRERWSLQGIVGLGVLAGLMGMVREQDLFVAVGPALDYALHGARGIRTGTMPLTTFLSRAAAGVAASALAFLPQIASYMVLYGRPSPHSSVEQKMNWLSPHAFQVLASPANGLVFWTPLAVLALAGLVLLAAGRVPVARTTAPDAARIGAICLMMVAAAIYVSGSVSTWQGSAFGQRRLVGLTIFLVIGLASLFRAVQNEPLRRGLAFAVVVCTWWNIGLAAQFGTGLMNRQRLEIAKNTQQNFVTIPRMLPGLAYRYVFDRESFYHSRRGTPP